MKRLVGIDSLRFFAVAFIVTYHLFREFLPGGFIAVEVFFCVSGFLIISKLIRQQDFRYGAFIKGRLKRLYPTLFICVLLTLIAALFVNPDVATGARVNSATALTFSTNIAELITGGNYENTFLPNLFEHTWFLALLFQLYLVMPLLFKLYGHIFKTNKNAIKFYGVTLLVLAITSMTLMALYGAVFEMPNRAYFAPDSHMAAFCLGGAFAVFNFFMPRAPRTKKYFPFIAFITSVVALVALSFVTHYDSPFASCVSLPLAGILTVVLLFCLIKLQKNIHARKKTLSIVRFFEGLGRLSYGIYIFHWPLYILLPQILTPDTAEWGYAVVNVILSFFLALGCHELSNLKNVRKKLMEQRLPMRISFAALALALVASAVVSLIRAPEVSSIAAQLSAAANRSNEEVVNEARSAADYIAANQLLEQTNQSLDQQLKLAVEVEMKLAPNKSIAAPNANSAKVLVIGDSVTLGAKAAIEATIAQSFVDAKESRGIETTTSILAGYAASGKLPNIIVVALATNYRDITESTLADIKSVIGKNHKLVLTTAYAGPLQPREKQNKVLKEYAKKHKDVFIMDWWEVAHNNWSLMYADHIHLNPEGRTAYANLLNNVLRGVR
ncbi:acyltransferase [Candidatus Saccharibacteria bacterium]|nr:acyltransferase [Candidatus Saccharibacteria bacterium]